MKKYVILIGIGIMLSTNSMVAYADPATQDSQGNLSVLRCLQKGNIDFGAFLSSMIYNDSFTEGIMEPWKDVLSRNSCQSSDIYQLIKQEDKIRSAIRDAFMTCNNQSVPQLKKAYQKMMVEIYYIRHIVDTGLLGRLPVPAQSGVLKDSAVANPDQLKKDMIARYVKESFMSQKDFDLLYKKLVNKYADRQAKYLECSTSVWEPVGKKWDEFMKFFADGAGLKDAKKTIVATAVGGGKKNDKGPSLVNEIKTAKFVELFTTKETVFEFVKSNLQLNVNNLTPTDALNEAQDYIKKHLGGSGLTQSQYLQTTQGAEAKYQMEAGITQIKANFDARYKSAADGSMEQFINALDGRNLGTKEEGTLSIINDSFTPLNDILSLTNKVKDRQCSSNQ
jgi:hypothetical protein